MLLLCWTVTAALLPVLVATATATTLPSVAAATTPPATDPMALCGAGEDGRDQPRGEGDTPFRYPWCCGNTTWSAFSFRAKFSRNVPFALDPHAVPPGLPPLPPAPWNQSQCTSYDNCFSFCFNHSDFKTCEGFGGRTAPEEWSQWRQFVPDSSFWCNTYPVGGLDPVSHMLLGLNVKGIWFGNMSTVTIQVKPEAGRSDEKPYQINATLSHIMPNIMTQTHMVWPKTPEGDVGLTANFMVARQNLTSSRALSPEPEISRAIWGAMPKIPKPPRQIVINHGYHGSSDVGAWQEATAALIGFGASALHGRASSDLQKVFAEAGVPAGVGFDGNFLSYHEYHMMGQETGAHFL